MLKFIVVIFVWFAVTKIFVLLPTQTFSFGLSRKHLLIMSSSSYQCSTSDSSLPFLHECCISLDLCHETNFVSACHHFGHYKYLVKWMVHGNKNTCPICRGPLEFDCMNCGKPTGVPLRCFHPICLDCRCKNGDIRHCFYCGLTGINHKVEEDGLYIQHFRKGNLCCEKKISRVY